VKTATVFCWRDGKRERERERERVDVRSKKEWKDMDYLLVY
jgi:hypothetical protein